MITLIVILVLSVIVKIYIARVGHIYKEQEFYSDAKTLKRIISYVKDNGKKLQLGISTTYYPNGSIESSLTYKWGKPHGVHIYYNIDGSVEHKEVFKEGQFVAISD